MTMTTSMGGHYTRSPNHSVNRLNRLATSTVLTSQSTSRLDKIATFVVHNVISITFHFLYKLLLLECTVVYVQCCQFEYLTFVEITL